MNTTAAESFRAVRLFDLSYSCWKWGVTSQARSAMHSWTHFYFSPFENLKVGFIYLFLLLRYFLSFFIFYYGLFCGVTKGNDTALLFFVLLPHMLKAQRNLLPEFQGNERDAERNRFLDQSALPTLFPFVRVLKQVFVLVHLHFVLSLPKAFNATLCQSCCCFC